MKLTKAQRTAMNKPVKGFDGGVYAKDGRNYSVVTTHGWAMRMPDASWAVPVVFQPIERSGDDEPQYYVLTRDEFLAEFTFVPPEPAPAA